MRQINHRQEISMNSCLLNLQYFFILKIVVNHLYNNSEGAGYIDFKLLATSNLI